MARPPYDQISFYGYWYCGVCDQEWEFLPQDNGTWMEIDHDCDDDEVDGNG